MIVDGLVLALAAPNRGSAGGGCCTLLFAGLFVYIYRSGGADWLRAIGAAFFPGLFGWFIWRDRDLGTGSRWLALIFASLHALSFVLGIVLMLLLKGGAFDKLMMAPLAAGTAAPTPVDLSNVPEVESLGLHPLATITSDPTGAKVFVNGQERGKTPLDTALAAGKPNEVRVELAGYFPATQDRSPNARENLALSFTLKAAARLTLTSEPAGARVLRGTRVILARTPGLVEPIEPGETEVVVLLDGYQAHRQTISVPAGDTALEVALKPGVKLSVTSTPDGANVVVDGAWLGLTPTDVYVSPKGKHTVEVTKEQWAPATKTFASVPKSTTFAVKLVDSERLQAVRAVAKARARYDQVNSALENLQVKIERTANVPARLERQRVALEHDMEQAVGALERAEAELRAIEDTRPPPREPAQ